MRSAVSPVVPPADRRFTVRSRPWSFWIAPAACAALLLCSSAARAEEAYTLTVETPSAHVGKTASVQVKVKAAKGHHINKQFPTTLQLTAPAGVKLQRDKFTVHDGSIKVEDAQALVDVGYTPTAPGKKAFTGTLRFAVCTDTNCDPKKVPVRFQVDVRK